MTQSRFRLAIVTTHPIQYNAPWFRLLAKQPGIEIKVFYTWSQTSEGPKFDKGFNKQIEWDIPLLDGYPFEFVENIARDPGVYHFNGIQNPSLIKKIKEWKPQALLIFGWNFRSHLACMRYFKGRIPILFRGDSTLLKERPGIKKWMRRIFLKWVYRFVDHAFYVGTNNKNYFLAHGLKEDQLHFAPHAIDNNRFAENASSHEEAAVKWRKKLGIDDQDFVLLYAGKLEPTKNLDFVLKLADEITDSNFRFLFVGNGSSEMELKKKASKDKRIIFLDFQNQKAMPVVYRLGDVFVLPSIGETWGLAVNEAMACGKPVIVSSNVGCAIDLIKPGESGFIVNPLNPKDCIPYIFSLIADKQKLFDEEMNAVKKIREFSFDSIVERVLSVIKIYNTTLVGTPSPEKTQLIN